MLPVVLLKKLHYGLKFDVKNDMETKKFRSCFFGNRSSESKASERVKEGIKVFAVGVFALLALGLFTSSERLNAG